MKKVVLICTAGLSTNLLVNKMRSAASEIGYDVTIDAYPMASIEEKGKDADIILLGPQVRYEMDKVSGKFPNIPVEVIDMKAYGSLDGMKVLKRVQDVVGPESWT